MKLLIILPAKIQAETPFLQRCKEQVVKYSPKMFWKVHTNWFFAKVFSLKTSRTLVLQTCINGMETGIPATTTEEQHFCRLQEKSLPDSCSVDSSINMRQSWMKSVENFALSYHRTPILWIWYHYGASPRTTLVSVVQTGSEMIQQRFSGGVGEYLQLPVLSEALSSN